MLYATCLYAQDYTRVDIGLGTLTESSTDENANYHVTSGGTVLGTYNLSRSLAVEGSFGYLPAFQHSVWEERGHEELGFGGLKMGRRGSRLGIYGKIEPGLVSFSCGVSFYGLPPVYNPYTNCERRTDFALQYGAVVQYALSPTTALRFDAAQTLATEFDQVIARYPSGALHGQAAEILTGHVGQHADFRFSIVQGFGLADKDGREGQAPQGRVDAGVFFALQPRVHLLDTDLQPDKGGGVWVSWNFSKYWSWDTTALYFERHNNNTSYQDGGNPFEGFSGFKYGIRRDRVGIFGKVRGGPVIFSRTESAFLQTQTSVTVGFSKFVDYGLDTGGVVEVYPYRRLILRAEAGEVSIFYPSTHVETENGPIPVAGLERSTMMLIFGGGYRF